MNIQRMKKLGLLLIVVVAFCLTACSQTKENNANVNKGGKDTKVLVAYFSATGTTKKAAERIAKAAHATLVEIEPQQPYTAEDLDWTNDKSRSSVEMKNKKFRPAIKKLTVNVDDYDVIYLGFPIWWGTCPTIINTFIESNNLEGKTVVPFATSGGSKIDKACKDLKSAYPKVNWKKGLLMNDVSDSELQKAI